MSRDVDVRRTACASARAATRRRRVARRVLRAERVRDALGLDHVRDRRRDRALEPRRISAIADRPTSSRSASTRDGRGEPVIGDIYIAPDVGARNALEQARSVREELARLVVHGVLHVLGHDHPEDEDAQRLADVAAAGDDARAPCAGAAR